jgi:N-methylhydantoinase A/oxoprolinase/acetone carboxylase beta subunit
VNLALGIDTGGTYTDAVLVNHDDGSVLAGAKALTTRHNLSEGIANALSALFQTQTVAHLHPRDIGLVSVSTTLATNALAESHSGAITLFLIGYDEGLMQQYGFSGRLSTHDVVYVRGGHNDRGEEVAPLDLEQVAHEVELRVGRTEAYAVSGYFSVRNPAHELQVRDLIARLTDCPVSCGHQLSSRLNAVRRATTTALNAHLILPLGELIRSLRLTISELGIAAPLMVVKGDGSLISADIAYERPIETILSGPAASVVGAWHLAGRRNVWVVDVGGTTTDIAALSDGAPRLNREGAQVASWRTMVEAIDVHTTGLGGDSHVRMDGGGELLIGPGRVIPICLLASQFPDVKAELSAQEAMPGRKHLPDSAQFLTRSREPGYTLSPIEQELLAMLQVGPRSLLSLVRSARAHGHYRRSLELLEQRGLARRAAFTPTDALHVLGAFRRWDADAAFLAASLVARQLGITAGELCERVVSGMSGQIASELVSKALRDSGTAAGWQDESAAAALVRCALDGVTGDAGELECRLTLRRPVVAIGAPVEAYLPAVASKLHTQLVIPGWSEVANAVGAVAGSVTQRARVSIAPIDQGERYRAYLLDGFHDFGHLEDAVAFVSARMLPEMEARVRAAGAEQVESGMRREDQFAPVAGNPDDRLYLGTELEFRASGRPAFARDSAPSGAQPARP